VAAEPAADGATEATEEEDEECPAYQNPLHHAERKKYEKVFFEGTSVDACSVVGVYSVLKLLHIFVDVSIV
jgi:hypothetical protein